MTDEPEFQFPFQPWPIQTQFMRHLYAGIENKKILIMESPTGTGKSLSLLCGSLQWITDYARKAEHDALAQIESLPINPGDPPWMQEFVKTQALGVLEEERARKRKRAERLVEIRKAEAMAGCRAGVKRPKTNTAPGGASDGDDDEEFVVEDYDSDAGSRDAKTSTIIDCETAAEPDAGLEPDELKIIYCSRTHSQISQFINEMKKTAFIDTKTVSLGSRQTLCINEDVRKLKSHARINDKCLDLMKKTNGEKTGCEYLPKDPATRYAFTDRIHATIKDIEDIVDTGKQAHACPYYGARDAVRPSQIIAMPYSILLHKATRESFNINVKGNVVVIDEAHNLIDAITQIYSVSVSRSELDRAKLQLTAYLTRYQKRLKGKNVLYIRQILLLMTALRKALEPDKKHASTIKMVNDFVHELDIDNINLFKIGRYLTESRLGQKLLGFTEKAAKNEKPALKAGETMGAEFVSIHASPVRRVEAFLLSLTNPDLEGRVVVTISGDDPGASSLKYLLLHPSNAFGDIVRDARAVVLAGGTMEPVRDLLEELFPDVPQQRISNFSCGHVIPSTSLLTMSVPVGPTKQAFDFRYENRNSTTLIDELGAAVANLCTVVPGGVVCFFVSYEYLDKVHDQWAKGSTLQRIQAKKKVFKEPRLSSEAELMLSEYTVAVKAAKSAGAPNSGAVLFAVMGGKMSEGINFSDDLGRLVIVVGMPFPNLRSPELQEKMRYIQARGATRSNGAEEPLTTANAYYENLCMKAVNQSIGRAIRHKDDYASIVLLDQRFSKDRIRQKLPGWIRDAGIKDSTSFGQVVAELAKRPILLHGHTRSLTKVKYNRDGDLLFTVSKDAKPNVWFAHNGERLGSYDGHNGAVWDLDVSYDSKRLLTASADNTCRLWGVESGKELFRWNTRTAVRQVAFAQGDRMALYVTDATMGQPSTIWVVAIEEDLENQSDEFERKIIINGPKATVASWGDLNKTIYTGHEDGTITIWDAETGEKIKSVKSHDSVISDMQWAPDYGYFITASKDHTAKIFDAKTLRVMKTYTTQRPVNSAALSPIRPHIALGGGQEAMEVTQIGGAKQGKFETRFFHLPFEEEIGRVKGHFGPINTLAFAPDGRSFASGAEDGFVRIHYFDDDYFEFNYEEESMAA
ncbi:DEAD H (Asp-Glu-Ala-Asp His) box helicase 11 [Geranomyces variabilis]|uniref:Eukaryotic translation initiation factor 3 subunit I n=1 Tax=Geranomyces variabilis TaxID=109894 RepID=A0AAD5XQD2_9FUNG|nr:DEAD H (Asp-Glu-Ala-Asp His) box helicase 11 [Geranomyces variabilis]